MSPTILSLPIEIQLKIAVSLLPGDGENLDERYDNSRTMSGKIEQLSTSLKHFRDLSTTCRTLREVCGQFCQAVRLAGGESHTIFLRGLETGNLPRGIMDGQRTRFLSIESPSSCDDCSHYGEPHEHTIRIERILSHFTAITTLDLVNARMTAWLMFVLPLLKSLRTFSIREPDRREKIYPFGRLKKKLLTLPRVESMNIVISDIVACNAATNFFWFLADNLVSLSIKSEIPLRKKGLDFLDRDQGIRFPHTGPSPLLKLKQLSIGWFECKAGSLHEFIAGCPSLEYLSINSRGMRGCIPLPHIVQLVQEITGHEQGDFVRSSWRALDFPDTGLAPDPEAQESGIQDSFGIETQAVQGTIAEFSCRFDQLGSETGGMKAIKDLELVSAGYGRNMDAHGSRVHFRHLSDTLCEHAPTFHELETLSIASSLQVGASFESRENESSLMEALSGIARGIPSIKKFIVDGHQIVPNSPRQ